MVTELWTSGSVRALAEESFAAWDAVLASVDAALAPELVALVRTEVAVALGSAEPRAWSESERACRALVDQFVVDVGSVTKMQRTAAFEVLGDQSLGFMQVLYVCDLNERLRAAWRQLYGTNVDAAPVVAGTDLWIALEEFMRTVARMQTLDPLTSELVRLRGARSHRCRLCQSRRSVRAAADGADESVYDQIDHYESSTLSTRHQTALRLVDAMLWQPSSYPSDLAGAAFECFSPGEIVEIVLDVVRNAANKIAVAFAADAAHVTEGVEFFDIDEQGEVFSVGSAG